MFDFRQKISDLDFNKINRGREWVKNHFSAIMNRELFSREIYHHGVKGQKWGVRNGPPYPLDRSGGKGIAKSGKGDRIKSNLQYFAKISIEKLTKYALDFDRQPDKASAFKKALGYTKKNAQELIDNVNAHFDKDKLVEKTDDGYGMRYEHVMRLKGPNGKEANVLTGWIEEEGDYRLTSIYVTKKKLRE